MRDVGVTRCRAYLRAAHRVARVDPEVMVSSSASWHAPGMFRFGRGRWSIGLQDTWTAEVEDGTVCVARPAGDGVLLISAADKDGVVHQSDLGQLAKGECPADADLGDCQLGDFAGLHAMYADQDMRWHRWYLGYGSQVLLVTYTVPLEREGPEDEAVMAMLRSLRCRGGAWE